MSNGPDEPIVIGKFGAPFGVKGWVKIHSMMDPEDNILSYKEWFVRSPNDDWHVYQVSQIKGHGDGFVAHLTDVDDRDQAASLTNRQIVIDRDMLPELDDEQYYWTDLVGFDVVTGTGLKLGKVQHLFETGANDVMVVKGQKEHLIPYVLTQYIVDVDLEMNLITVNWDPEF